MKNLADLKRRLVKGAALVMTFHSYERAAKTLVGVPRTVEIVQTNSIAFCGSEASQGRPSWMNFPKAKDLRIDGPDAFTILDGGQPAMSYRFLSEAEAAAAFPPAEPALAQS